MKLLVLVMMLVGVACAFVAYFWLPNPTRVMLNRMSIVAGMGVGTILMDVLRERYHERRRHRRNS